MAVVCATAFFVSCENSIEEIQEITTDEIEPDEIARGVTIQYTDSGYTKMTLYSDEYKRYFRRKSLHRIYQRS